MEVVMRRPGEDPRKEARAEERGASTAKQIAVWLCMEGLIPTSERNYVSPRLTELCEKGMVEPIGKTRCVFTGKKVTVYGLRGD